MLQVQRYVPMNLVTTFQPHVSWLILFLTNILRRMAISPRCNRLMGPKDFFGGAKILIVGMNWLFLRGPYSGSRTLLNSKIHHNGSTW